MCLFFRLCSLHVSLALPLSLSVVKVDLSLRKAIAQARNAKGWKQKDLAQVCVVVEEERGTNCPTSSVPV